MNFEIKDIQAIEILDSRGRPTLSVAVELTDGTRQEAGVPSGASTGTREAVELRDGDSSRFGGAGVLTAVANVNGELRETLAGRTWSSLDEVDEAMRDLDATENKSRLGANALIGTSMALARALAAAQGKPLYEWLTGFGEPARMPVPCFNVLNGGAHAPNDLDFQEFMVCPLGAPSMAEAVRAGAEVYQALRKRLVAGSHATGLGDEGGFAPNLAEPEEVLDLIVAAISDAGYPLGSDGVGIALDPAASEFYSDGGYVVNGSHLSSSDMIDRYAAMLDRFPIWSIEDGLGEQDPSGWKRMTETIGERVQLVGDDNFCTNPAIIAAAIDDGIANAALIKVNQIGTVTETLTAMRICHEAGYGQMVSHRSGETPDTFIADLAVATGCGQLKTGAPARGERVAKYNRLIQIATERPDLPYGLGR
ncbi:phosphopyruvate hydratase [Flaviflexus salsibiostraticola]|uniref:Enolase n=1 Tax=Flaviflexus salsibiostraticola TaxID=1282737 RepID=A0A3S8Z8B6_9ACTO|nr:phosphopyruvate hydratase [Flaviflexus salsibiostraticola]AZN29802.1 phosphopyruvate hydratase [Flaviflexus salsibiostraticola]